MTIWSRTDGPSGPSLSVIFTSGEPITIRGDHPAFKEITLKLVEKSPEAEILELVNPAKGIVARFNRLSERVTTDGANIFFDGDILNDGLTDYILELLRAEAAQEDAPSWKPFVAFLEKLANNPSKSSRESLYAFITAHGLTIRKNGDFIAYKGLTETFTSIHSGPGIVNDRPVHGQLDNTAGNVVELQRSLVVEDQNNACTVGLHAGTINFAANYGTKLVAVAINPRDVVSVPNDSSRQKLRVCRYEVISEVPRPVRDSTAVPKLKPFWDGPQASPTRKPSAKPETAKVVKQLEKAIASNSNLTLNYRSLSGRVETYSVTPLSLSGDILRLTLVSNPKAHRQFLVEGILSLEVIPAVTQKAVVNSIIARETNSTLAPEKDEVQELIAKAIAKGRTITFTYRPEAGPISTYSIKPAVLDSGNVRGRLTDQKDAYRQFTVSKIRNLVLEPKKNKGKKKKKN